MILMVACLSQTLNEISFWLLRVRAIKRTTETKEELDMNYEQFKDLMFYMWQLDIKTLGELARFKSEHKAETNEQLLAALCRTYNS